MWLPRASMAHPHLLALCSRTRMLSRSTRAWHGTGSAACVQALLGPGVPAPRQ